MSVSHIGFSPPCPNAAERVHMALCEVGLGHLRPEPFDDPHAEDKDGWTIPLSPFDDPLVVEQVWRARELTDGGNPLCFRHFRSPARQAAACRASRSMTMNCEEMP